MQHSAAAERISECTICRPALGLTPEFSITRCVHFDGHQLALFNTGHWWVQWVIAPPWCADEDGIEYMGYCRDEAEAAFYEAEEALLRGGD